MKTKKKNEEEEASGAAVVVVMPVPSAFRLHCPCPRQVYEQFKIRRKHKFVLFRIDAESEAVEWSLRIALI